MPSGKKKRKAAKKKQENQSNNHHPSSSSAQTHEGDEVSSPASQDHHSNQNNLTEEEEEEIDEGDNVSNHPSVEGVKNVDKPPNTVVDENFVPVEREFKFDDESDKKDDGGFDHDETASKSYDGGSSGDSSTSSSSDDESQEIKNSQAVVENIPAVISEVDLSFAANNSVAPSIVESEFKENGEKKLSSEEDKVGISDTTECVAQETNDRSSPSYNPPIASVNNGADQEKDSGISEPLLAPAPQPVQTTSWKSCCGLFEVFAGSGR